MMMAAASLAARSPASAPSRVPCETTVSHVSHPKRLVRRLQASTSTSASTSTTSATPQQLTDTHETLNFPIERVISDWQTGYVSLHGERSDVKLDVTSGAIPNSLKGGVLIRNGPGALERGGAKLNQPFDGDGMLVRLAFDTEGDSVNFSNAYVKTQGYVDEVAANKFIYKSAFSTGNPAGDWFYNPFDFSTKNVANTHVALLGGRLLALWEGGLPHVVDPKTLQTTEKESRWVDGSVDAPFAAHYKRAAAPPGQTGRRLVNFGAKAGPGEAIITFYEFEDSADANGRCVSKRVFQVPGAGFGFFHDMVVTPSYYILFQNPVEIDGRALLTEYTFGQRSLAGCLQYIGGPEQPSRVLVFPRGEKHEAHGYQSIELDPHFVFHHGNAFEREDGTLVIDSVHWREFDFTATVDVIPSSIYVGGMRSEMHRVEINPANPSARGKRQRISNRCCEFPTIHPRCVGSEHRYMYAAASPIDHPVLWSPNQGVVKFDMETNATQYWHAGDRRFTGEPIFVPSNDDLDSFDGDEDAGNILVLVHDAEEPDESKRTSLAILDAQNIEDGPVATVAMPETIPFGLHGEFVSAKKWAAL
ncbi:retinal pigment epithelial membrane protein [Pycnococcus provasolii]|uniref:Retinal pigment epithelial membrane protein n=1 Tax=Pycnococcus provasolii TaxID=41880 RepID=A0A830HE43_9CHLO|nr:retinal pigment epithelial membrane protein [Pycnococcus provasolii]